jgi:hypothetical protein
MERMTDALHRIEDDRELSAAESRQLDTYEFLRDALRLALPSANSANFMLQVSGALTELFRHAHEATVISIPMADLLGMRAAMPRGPRWNPLLLGIESLAWCGVTPIVDDLRLICTTGDATPERQRQLAIMRDLQGALAMLIELDAAHRRFQRANARVKSLLTDTAKTIGDQITIVRAEAAGIRARRR